MNLAVKFYLDSPLSIFHIYGQLGPALAVENIHDTNRKTQHLNPISLW